jgi:hypothetical protein
LVANTVPKFCGKNCGIKSSVKTKSSSKNREFPGKIQSRAATYLFSMGNRYESTLALEQKLAVYSHVLNLHFPQFALKDRDNASLAR